LDIKTQNFILVRGQMKVIDLGCAEQIPIGENYVMCKLSKGTEGSLAPECKTPSDGSYFRYSIRTDSYSLGVTLTFLLSKTKLLNHNHQNMFIYFQSIVRKCLLTDQSARPSAKQMLEDLVCIM